MLLDEGYGVETATDGLDAINQLVPAPDLILLDLTMPFMDGLEFLGRLRKTSKDNQIPVLVMTAQYVGPTIDGAQGILRKPFELTTLLERVSDLLD